MRSLASTNVARVPFRPGAMCGRVCCWFSPLLRGFFSGFSGFPPFTKTNISKFEQDREIRMNTSVLSKYCKFSFFIFIVFVLYLNCKCDEQSAFCSLDPARSKTIEASRSGEENDNEEKSEVVYIVSLKQTAMRVYKW